MVAETEYLFVLDKGEVMPTTGYQAIPMYGIIMYDPDDLNVEVTVSGMLHAMLFETDVNVVYHDELDHIQGLDVTIGNDSPVQVGNNSLWILVDPFNNTVREIPYPFPVFTLRGVVEWKPNSDTHG
jgi:hypothetical protein